MELAEVAVDAISVDGVTIREKFGNPSDWFMAKQPRKAKNIRSLVMQENSNVKITFEGPSETELNEWLASLQQRVEDIGSKVEDIANFYGEEFEDIAEDFGDELEDEVGDDLMHVVNEIGDQAKKIADEAKVDWYLMAAKKASTKSASSNASFYGGAAAGFFSVVALGAMYAACQRKKTVQANEETLL